MPENKHHLIFNDFITYFIPGSIFLVLFFLSDAQFFGCTIYCKLRIDVLLKECSSFNISSVIAGIIFVAAIPYFLGHIFIILGECINSYIRKKGLSNIRKKGLSNKLHNILEKDSKNMTNILKYQSYFEFLKSMVLVFSLLIMFNLIFLVANFCFKILDNCRVICTEVNKCQGPSCQMDSVTKQESKTDNNNKRPILFNYFLLVIEIIFYIVLLSISCFGSKMYHRKYESEILESYNVLKGRQNI